ncbi:lipase/esterase [Apiospora kogelbergensis]|uniref:Lipase/esterase n=1 Tax=Apiospora kogelbergensis TaxID=1337665 RepID=A0AAW0QXC8_9PEZI
MPRTREELLSLGVVDPALAAELVKHPIRNPQPSDPYYGRNDYSAHREHRATKLRELHHLRYLPGPIPDQVVEEDHKIPPEITVRIYRPSHVAAPAAVAQSRPLIVMYHEGGWAMGDLTDEEVNCRLFCRDLGAVCVNVDYRLAPEFPFPTWINDSWDALQWAAKNATSLGADPSAGFIIGGGSAGGNIAAVLAHVARDEGLSPPLTGQYLCVPAITCFRRPELLPERYRDEYLSHPGVTRSGDQATDPVLNDLEKAEEGMRALLKVDTESPLFVPFLFGERSPGATGTCRRRTCRSAGLTPCATKRILREEADVRTRLDLYPGLGHYFWTNFPRLDASRRFVEDTIQGVKWLLEQQKKT